MYENRQIPSDLQTISLIRDSIVGELSAIMKYANHINKNKNDELNDLLSEILGDEKKHYNMLLELLRTYDKEQFYQHERTNKEHINIGGIAYNAEFVQNADNLQELQEEIQGELVAINDYEKQISIIRNKHIRQTLHSIILDEKQHVEELNRAITDLSSEVGKNS